MGQPHTFDLATASVAADGGWAAEVDPGWTIVGRPNGGYLLALLARAALAVAGRPDPLAVSAHFLAAPSPGPATVAVTTLRSGRSLSVLRAGLAQEGRSCVEALVTAGTLDPSAGPAWRASGP